MRELTMGEIDCVSGGADNPSCVTVNTSNGSAVICSCPNEPIGSGVLVLQSGDTVVVKCQ